MSGFKFLCFFNCHLVGVLRFLDDLLSIISGLEFSKISVVITLHFLEENDCFWVLFDFILFKKVIIQQIEDILANALELLFNFVLVLSD